MLGDVAAQAVVDLDDTIKVIRSTIFGLQEHDTSGHIPGPRSQILQICQDTAEMLGFAPALRFTGPVDFEVPEQMVEHALAVTREALSNAARHAGASRVAVDLETSGGHLRLRITDDGVGTPDEGRRSGLANVAATGPKRWGHVHDRSGREGRDGPVVAGAAGLTSSDGPAPRFKCGLFVRAGGHRCQDDARFAQTSAAVVPAPRATTVADQRSPRPVTTAAVPFAPGRRTSAAIRAGRRQM